jgi:hypothetical protein
LSEGIYERIRYVNVPYTAIRIGYGAMEGVQAISFLLYAQSGSVRKGVVRDGGRGRFWYSKELDVFEVSQRASKGGRERGRRWYGSEGDSYGAI